MPGRTAARNTSWNVPTYQIKLAALILVAMLCLAGGLDSLSQHFRADEPRPYRASSGALLVLAALSQAFFLTSTSARTKLQSFLGSNDFWWLVRFTLIAGSLGYVGMLSLGPDVNLRYAFRAYVALCYTGCLGSLVAWGNEPSLQRWRHRLGFRRLESAMTCIVVVVLVLEIAMQMQATVTNDSLGGISIARRQSFVPGSFHGGRPINRLGYWDDEFSAEVHPQRFRIAALGDSALFSGDCETNCLERVESMLPQSEIYNFTLPGLSPREYAAQLKCDVLAYLPDLVLLFVSVENDVTEQIPLPGLFDWRGLRICQWGLQTVAAPSSVWHGTQLTTASATEQDRMHPDAIIRFAVCRTPIEDRIERQWQNALSHLSAMIDICQRHDIPLAFVLVPAAFQVDASLRRRICHRGGYQERQVDIELPQRRLTSFAFGEEVPSLDLLPDMSASSERLYLEDSTELNRKGQQLVATTVAGWVERSFESEISERRESLLANDETLPTNRSASVPRRGTRPRSSASAVK